MPGVWTRSEIEALANPGSFLRGVGYQRGGRVEIGDRHGDGVTAVVRGSMPYHVELRRSPTVAWSCNYPVGEDGAFCTHCVAVALDEAGPDRTSKRPDRSGDQAPDVREFVAGLDTEVLVDLVMEQVDSDWRLRERLTAQAIAYGGGSLDTRIWKRRIDAVFGDSRHFVPYAEAGGWAQNQDIFDVLAALDDLVNAGHSAAVVALAEHAHRRSARRCSTSMTAKGWLTGISRRIGELHLAACREARPDQVELAGQLAELELTSELDTFHRAAATYADVLGPDGIAAYRRIVEPNWRAAKKNKDPLWARSVRCDPGDDRRRLGPVVIPTTSSPSEAATSTRPTTTWRSHGRWSQPGGKPSRWTGLGAALTRSSTGSGRRPRCASSSPLSSGPPATIRRQRTSGGRRSRPTRPSTATASFSPRAPMPRPDGEKPSISSASASTQATPKQGRAIRCSNGPPATTLVEILLYEGRADEAWSAATAHGCDERMWMTLARAREGTHPFDAIPIYERAVAAQTDMKNNGGYRAAVDLLARIRTLATKADQPERFSDLLSAVKTEHDRKRNLMALIDKKRWS